jgi:hypothetical protein
VARSRRFAAARVSPRAYARRPEAARRSAARSPSAPARSSSGPSSARQASRRVVELGPRTLAVLEEQWRRTSYRDDDDLVFGHPTKGTPLEAGKLANHYLRPALARAGIETPFRPFHDLRHTSLTHAAAAGNPQIYVQARAGHSQGWITERYMHAAQVLFPGAAAKRARSGCSACSLTRARQPPKTKRSGSQVRALMWCAHIRVRPRRAGASSAAARTTAFRPREACADRLSQLAKHAKATLSPATTRRGLHRPARPGSGLRGSGTVGRCRPKHRAASESVRPR